LYSLTGAFEMRRPFRFEKKRRIFDLCTADTWELRPESGMYWE
jgi:hypothetical protein